MLSINNTTQDIDSKIISDKQTLINQTTTSTKPPVLSLEDLTMNINKSAVDDINNNPILKLNSKATTEYITSLHNKLHELQNENEELKINFIQVSEMVQKEREDNVKKEKFYLSRVEILEKEKMRHLEQNALDKENLEILLENAKKENEKISMRLKELVKENETLRNENFSLNVKIIELNKIEYENQNLKEKIKNNQIRNNFDKTTKINSNVKINKIKTYTKNRSNSKPTTPTRIKKYNSTSNAYQPTIYQKVTINRTPQKTQINSLNESTLMTAYKNCLSKLNVSTNNYLSYNSLGNVL